MGRLTKFEEMPIRNAYRIAITEKHLLRMANGHLM